MSGSTALLLGDLVVTVHFLFVAFVILGGALIWRWPRLAWPSQATLASLAMPASITTSLRPVPAAENSLGSGHPQPGADHRLDHC